MENREVILSEISLDQEDLVRALFPMAIERENGHVVLALRLIQPVLEAVRVNAKYHRTQPAPLRDSEDGARLKQIRQAFRDQCGSACRVKVLPAYLRVTFNDGFLRRVEVIHEEERALTTKDSSLFG